MTGLTTQTLVDTIATMLIMDTIADSVMIGTALSEFGYNSSQVTQILSGNWLAIRNKGYASE